MMGSSIYNSLILRKKSKLANLPVITAMGGISPAGRSAHHYGYKRLVFDKLGGDEQQKTLINLAVLSERIHYNGKHWEDSFKQEINLDAWLAENRQSLLDSTLIRKLENNIFDPTAQRHHNAARMSPPGEAESFTFTVRKRHLPNQIPENWEVRESEGIYCEVTVTGKIDVMIEDTHASPVNYAGQLPSGFDPSALYASRNHPRALQMTIFSISDALYGMGIDWEVIRQKVAPEQIGIYACSSMSQLDYNGNGGMLQARLLGKKVTSKQLPLGFCDMPANFINAYVLGNVGSTGTSLGACATFHYNLAQAAKDIQNGTHRVVIVGGSEAAILPEIIEAFNTMGAIASDDVLQALDGGSEPAYRRSCRPFGNNIGFTLGESSQFFILMDDALALELGASIYGSINDVFVNADGFKKSIASPGVGNYLTFARAAAATKAVLGEHSLRHNTFIQAHGTGTPQNRVTESAILEDVARQFGVTNWKVSAIKSYLGHSLGVAGADQLASSLGIWQYGVLPGILTTESIAEDVHQEGLEFLLDHQEIDPASLDSILLNAKGFGGNNATASVLSPDVTRRMLEKRHGKQAMTNWEKANEATQEASREYEAQSNRQSIRPVYHFDHDVRGGSDLTFSDDSVSLRGYGQPVNLNPDNKYDDMC